MEAQIEIVSVQEIPLRERRRHINSEHKPMKTHDDMHSYHHRAASPATYTDRRADHSPRLGKSSLNLSDGEERNDIPI